MCLHPPSGGPLMIHHLRHRPLLPPLRHLRPHPLLPPLRHLRLHLLLPLLRHLRPHQLFSHLSILLCYLTQLTLCHILRLPTFHLQTMGLFQIFRLLLTFQLHLILSILQFNIIPLLTPNLSNITILHSITTLPSIMTLIKWHILHIRVFHRRPLPLPLLHIMCRRLILSPCHLLPR